MMKKNYRIKKQNMPQECLRSVVYRSFVTCSDPKGVVECGTIRKSKNDSPNAKHKIESQMTRKNLNNSPRSSQLLEVSNEAQKLNQMIDSWSVGMTYDAQSKDIAKDLLKGALDLQDSLVVLSELQQDSQYMSQLKKKQKFEEHRIDEVSSTRTKSNQFGFQKPQFYADGSLMNCVEELRDMDSSSEMPSTSSSQSSTFPSDKFDSTDSSFSSAGLKKMAKSSNLIARLMGPEATSSKPSLNASKVLVDREKNVYQGRSISDTDMLKVGKPQFAVQKVDPERRISKEVLDTMQFKGLLKGTPAKGLKHRLIDGIPPIVLIKPLNTEEPFRQLSPEIEDLNAKIITRKSKVQDELLHKTVERKKWTLSSKKMCRKVDTEETPIKRLGHKGTKECKEVEKQDEKEIKNRERAMEKASLQKKESIDKKASKIQLVRSSSRTPLSSSRDQDKVTTTKLRKPKNESYMMKKQMLQRRSTTLYCISKKTALTVIPKSSQRMKEMPVREPASANIVKEKLRTHVTNGNGSIVKACQATPMNKFLTAEEADAHQLQLEEQCSDNLSPLDVVTLSTSKPKKYTKTTEDTFFCIGDTRTNSKFFKGETSMKPSLLGSPFLSHDEELLDLHMSSPIVLQTSSISDFEATNANLYLDCASELVQRISLPDSQRIHPLPLLCAGNSRTCITLDQLVEEVCDGIEILRSYTNLSDENHCYDIDSIGGMVERDIWSNGVTSGIWDMGWRKEFSAYEIEQAVNDMEKLLLNRLIDELFV